MANPEEVEKLRIELNKEFMGLSKEETAKIKRLTPRNNIGWMVREGYPQLLIYGMADEDDQNTLIHRVDTWLHVHRDFERVYLRFCSNESGKDGDYRPARILREEQL